jgi:hypothetical protein
MVQLGALSGLGIAMLALVAAGPWIARAYDFAVLVPAIAASGLLTIAAVALAPSVPQGAGLVVVLALALAMRLLLIGEPPQLSTDIYRYIWDGRVQAAGLNPYLLVPADPALAYLRDAVIYPNINRADYAVTAYPPVAQMFFLGATRIGETLTIMRLAMVACEVVVVAVVVDLLRQLRLPVVAVVAWAWHPLVIWEIAGSGHVEALMVALLMLGVWLMVRGGAVAAVVTVTLAALVKPYAVLVLPAFWRRGDWRLPLVVVVTAAAFYLPYLGAGRGVLGFLASGYLSEEGLTGGDGFWLVALVRGVFGPVPGSTAVYLSAAAGAMAWLSLRITSGGDVSPRAQLRNIALLLMAGLFLLSLNYPWYVLALVPFTVLGGGAPAWAMTLGAILLYRPWLLPQNDFAWETLATLPFLVAVAFVLLRNRRAATPLAGASQWTS